MKLEKFKQRDPKKMGVIVFTVACILLIVGVFFYTSFASFEVKQDFNIINGTVGDPGDLYFAFYVDDVISKTMPQKGEGYVIDQEKTTCNNGASIEFNTDDWSIKVLNMTTSRTKCTLYFREQTFSEVIQSCNDTAANCLNNNANLNTVELAYDNTTDNNLRYVGANPNNYVSFNNELWRIIGVMNNIDNGTGKKESRIKIIRDESIGENEWDDMDAMGQNNWTKSILKDLLNTGAYYNRTTGIYGDFLQKPVDFTSTGLTNGAKSLIDNAVWNLGGFDSTNYNIPISYTKERGTEVYNGNPTTWTGKVGLIYPSDYGYATSGGSTTNRENCLNIPLSDWTDDSSTKTWECVINNWIIKGKNSLWTISHSLYLSTDVIYVSFMGFVSTTSAYTPSIDIAPVTYLSSNVKISGGDGSEGNPFILSL